MVSGVWIAKAHPPPLKKKSKILFSLQTKACFIMLDELTD